VGVFGEPPPIQTAAHAGAADILASAGTDGALRLWSLRDRKALAVLRTDMQRRAGHDARAVSLAFSPDTTLLASAHIDGSLHLWDVRRGQEFGVHLRHDAVTALAFSPAGDVLASAGMDSTLRLWDVAAARSGEARRELHRQPVGVTALAYAPCGLLTGHAQGLIRLQDPRTLRLAATLRGPRALVSLLAPSPDGGQLVVGGQDRTLRLMELPSGNVLWTVMPHRRHTGAVAFLPCGTVLATAALENATQLLDRATGTALAALWGRPEEVVVSVCAPTAGGLATILGDGRVRLWAVPEN
jgi:WD40 repeat protein